MLTFHISTCSVISKHSQVIRFKFAQIITLEDNRGTIFTPEYSVKRKYFNNYLMNNNAMLLFSSSELLLSSVFRRLSAHPFLASPKPRIISSKPKITHPWVKVISNYSNEWLQTFQRRDNKKKITNLCWHLLNIIFSQTTWPKKTKF